MFTTLLFFLWYVSSPSFVDVPKLKSRAANRNSLNLHTLIGIISFFSIQQTTNYSECSSWTWKEAIHCDTPNYWKIISQNLWYSSLLQWNICRLLNFLCKRLIKLKFEDILLKDILLQFLFSLDKLLYFKSYCSVIACLGFLAHT